MGGHVQGGFRRLYSKNSFWSFICNVSTIFWAVKTRKVGLTPTPILSFRNEQKGKSSLKIKQTSGKPSEVVHYEGNGLFSQAADFH